MVDNRAIQLTHYHPQSGQRETHRFASIPHLLNHPAIDYGRLLRHDEPMQHLLDLSCEKLAALRHLDADAAGLVVASDIAHAEEIADALEDRLQTVCLVTSKEPSAHARLQAFRDDTTPWIVSVGMVSEGVDIPRLRVCCYLSHIRTEQHFRQVLGRIIRRQGEEDAECFLYALIERHLRRYARRITDDLPDDLSSVTWPSPGADGPMPDGTLSQPYASAPSSEGDGDTDAAANTGSTPDPAAHGLQVSLGREASCTAGLDPDVAFSQAFFARLVALQLPPP